MTREQARKHLAVIQAWAEGQEIENKCVDEQIWHPIPSEADVAFAHTNVEYRIKPQPRHAWLVYYGPPQNGPSCAYKTLEQARKRHGDSSSEVKIVEFVEVVK